MTGFPIDWNAWRTEWEAWKNNHAADLVYTSWKFPPKNFLADEVLGVWRIIGRTVELSEVTFPDLGNVRQGVRKRYVGITYGDAVRTESGGLAESFNQLEKALGIG